jgi:hypothetical protein
MVSDGARQPLSHAPRSRTLPLLVLLVTLAMLALLACFNISSHDLGYHLATGRYLLEHHRIPSHNVLSFALPDHPWLLHQWLPALALTLVERACGSAGLWALQIALALSTMGCVWLAARTSGARSEVSSLLTVLGAAGAASKLSYLRPELFSYLLLAALYVPLLAWHRRPRRPLLIWIACLPPLAVNLHAGGLYLYILSGALLATEAAAYALSRSGLRVHAKEPRQILELAACFAVSAAAGLASVALVNPWGASVLWLPFRYSADPAWRSLVVEFAPLRWLDFARYPFFWSLLIVSGAALVINLKRTPLLWWVLFVTSVLLAQRHDRLVYFATIVVVPLASSSWSSLFERWGLFGRARMLPIISLGCTLVVGLLGVAREATANPFGCGVNPRVWPREAFQFVRDQRLAGQAFTTDDISGSFLGEFYPARRVFFDNRLEAYSRDFMVSTYLTVRDGAPGWRALVDRYRIDLLVLSYARLGRSHALGSTTTLSDRLGDDRAFALIYFDDYAMVWARRSRQLKAAIDSFGYDLVNPDRFWFSRDDRERTAALEGDLRRRLQRQPPCWKAYRFLAALLEGQGRYREAIAVLRQGVGLFPDSSALLLDLKRAEGAAR